MIVSFSVSNFRSFAAEETISLVASKRIPSRHETHLVPIPGSKEHALSCAVLYGANGGGKSNLFRALGYLSSLAIDPRGRLSGTGREPFRFGATTDAPSTFDLQFVADGKLYRYGLEVQDDRVIEEWLLHIVGTREKTIFERTTNSSGEVTVKLGTRTSPTTKLGALATVVGPQNQSFLATANTTLDTSDLTADIRSVIRWFSRGLVQIGPSARFASLGRALERDSDFRRFAGEFLHRTSTGVHHLEIEKNEVSESELRGYLDDKSAAEMFDQLAEEDDGGAVVGLKDGIELVVEQSEGKRNIYQITVRTAHEHGSTGPLELAEESDGTRRLLHLLPALYRLRKGGCVFFIDEIDRSLHPILVREFLSSFLKEPGESPRQIIVTTHESSLLDQDLLRRDEVWFVEKDLTEATRLYSLADFKVRNDLGLRKHYLQGRFGAIPFIGDVQLTSFATSGEA